MTDPTELDYRKLNLDSSSSLKDFSTDRNKYYRKYVLREKVEEKNNQAITVGRVVETLLIDPEEFDNRFYMSGIVSAPTGLMLAFVEALYSSVKKYTKHDDLTVDFETCLEEAYIESKFKIKIEAVLGKFKDSDAEIYFNEILAVRSKNLTVITLKDVTNAEKIVAELQYNPITRDIVNLKTSERYEVLNQLQIHNYEYLEHRFKSMIDKVIVDHKEKTIEPYDLKCVWAVEGFYKEYYLYRRTYIQMLLYYQACISLTKPGCRFAGYTVKLPVLLVCDSTAYFSPLLYTLTEKDLQDALNGFEVNGKFYEGVESIVKNLKWAINEGIWNISRTNYLNRGKVNIKTKQ
jgi:hypothetical protein